MLVLGFLLGLLVRVWLSTLRVRMCVDPAVDLSSPKPMVFAFWHGEQMGALAARALRPTPKAVMVSWSRDGRLQAGVMRALGFKVVRGSSSRGGASALRALFRLIGSGHDVVFAVDGPRGPIHVAKPGAHLTAKRADARLVPLTIECRACLVLDRAWDRFRVPLPFSTVDVSVGSPVPSNGGVQHLQAALRV